ncbi:MAG: hypothetical protein WAV98_02585 [Minisyncoccia bacterium]
MIKELATRLLAISLVEILLFLALVCVVFAGYLLYMIWTTNPELLKEYRKLTELCERANKGNIGAQSECESDYRVKKGMVLCEDGVNVKSTYSVQPSMFYQIWGYY